MSIIGNPCTVASRLGSWIHLATQAPLWVKMSVLTDEEVKENPRTNALPSRNPVMEEQYLSHPRTAKSVPKKNFGENQENL